MNTVVFEHVPLSDLPAAWRAKLPQTGFASESQVTVRIEQEAAPGSQAPEPLASDDPAFGIWRDRTDMDDVAAYVQNLRRPRYNRDGSRNPG